MRPTSLTSVVKTHNTSGGTTQPSTEPTKSKVSTNSLRSFVLIWMILASSRCQGPMINTITIWTASKKGSFESTVLTVWIDLILLNAWLGKYFSLRWWMIGKTRKENCTFLWKEFRISNFRRVSNNSGETMPGRLPLNVVGPRRWKWTFIVMGRENSQEDLWIFLLELGDTFWVILLTFTIKIVSTFTLTNSKRAIPHNQFTETRKNL